MNSASQSPSTEIMSNEPVPETKSVSAFSCRLSNGTSDDSTVISVPWMLLYSSAWEAI